MRSLALIVAVTLGVILPAGNAQADPYTLTAESANGNLSASASFEFIGNELMVVLTNTSTADVLVPADILTAVFFDIEGVGALTPLTAVLTAGSTVLFDSAPADGVVGGEWGYGSGLAGAPLGATEGISSSGFGLFGNSTFVGPDLDTPLALNGLNYGITSAGDNPLTGNAKVTSTEPLIKNSVTFKLGGDFTNVNLYTAVKNVSFQYGTSLGEPNIRVPEPSTMLLFGVALSALGIGKRRKAA